jgi:hypothetical protein
MRRSRSAARHAMTLTADRLALLRNVEFLAEPLRAIVIGLVVLIQAAYLRRFYRRAWFIARTGVRRAFARFARSGP